MPIYNAPVDDMLFLMHDVFQVEKHILSLPRFSDFSFDLIETVLTEAGKLCEQRLFPLNQTGDIEGCQYEQGQVKTPNGFKTAYQTMVEGGWLSLVNPRDTGGQGLPYIINIFLQEMLCAANVSFSLYVELTQGCFHFLQAYGSDTIKKHVLPKLNTGEWSGVMCLTEPHCGTDLSLIKTKAIPDTDNKYAISGTKIFITGGEHDLTENIIHIVLARLHNAPEGIKGISVFLVPKMLIDHNGEMGDKNRVFCQGIEHKMGLKGSATCTMEYDNAVGFLIGDQHDGLRCMFTMMNRERLSIGMEGLGLASVSYQNALQYAKERLQGRALTGTKDKQKKADPILVHPDVRHMLLSMKIFVEGARALACWLAIHIDLQTQTEHQEQSHALIEFLTPVVKAFFTDYGFQACNQGIQVLGGHGYIAEWGMEQYARDARVSLIYEGTNGVQAMDLVKRKLVSNQGEYASIFLKCIHAFSLEHKVQLNQLNLLKPLEQVCHNVKLASQFIIDNGKQDPNVIGSSATAYLHLIGLCALAFMWGKIAVSSDQKPDKLKSAGYFMEQVLPKATLHTDLILTGATNLMGFNGEDF